ILYLIRVCVWWLMLSLLVVTIPPALAGLYYAVREGLRDPFELQVKPRTEFLRGVGLHFKRSYLVTLFNLGALAVIVFGVVFWFTRAESALRLTTVIALAFLLFWWLCQPFLFALLVEYPSLSACKCADGRCGWSSCRRSMRSLLRSPIPSSPSWRWCFWDP